MSTREIAYSIFNQFDEEALQGFIAFFSKFYPPKIDTKADYSEFGNTTDNMEERRAAFERLEKMCRHIPDIDEKKELAEYREEKYSK